jgi:hypothetical protein
MPVDAGIILFHHNNMVCVLTQDKGSLWWVTGRSVVPWFRYQSGFYKTMILPDLMFLPSFTIL